MMTPLAAMTVTIATIAIIAAIATLLPQSFPTIINTVVPSPTVCTSKVKVAVAPIAFISIEFPTTIVSPVTPTVPTLKIIRTKRLVMNL